MNIRKAICDGDCEGCKALIKNVRKCMIPAAFRTQIDDPDYWAHEDEGDPEQNIERKEKARLWDLVNDAWMKAKKNAEHDLHRAKRVVTIVREAGNHELALDLTMAAASLENVMDILNHALTIGNKQSEVCPRCQQPIPQPRQDR